MYHILCITYIYMYIYRAMLHGCRLNPPMFLGAKWPRLLDVAETAKIFGLVPQGELDKAWGGFHGKSWKSLVIGLMIFGKNEEIEFCSDLVIEEFWIRPW